MPVPRGHRPGAVLAPAPASEHAFGDFGLNGEPKVLYVGRLSREKGLDALIDGFELLGEELPGAQVW